MTNEEKRRAYHREWKRKKRLDPEFRKKQAQVAARYYKKRKAKDPEWARKRNYEWKKLNPSRWRVISNASRKKYLENHPELKLKWNRAWYKRHRDKILKELRDARRKINPATDLYKLIARARRGEYDIGALVEEFSRALAKLEQEGD